MNGTPANFGSEPLKIKIANENVQIDTQYWCVDKVNKDEIWPLR